MEDRREDRMDREEGDHDRVGEIGEDLEENDGSDRQKNRRKDHHRGRQEQHQLQCEYEHDVVLIDEVGQMME